MKKGNKRTNLSIWFFFYCNEYSFET